MNVLRTFRLTRTHCPSTLLRPLSTTLLRRTEGATGSMRSGGDRHADSWTRREKAAEDLYIKGREKAIMQLLKEKIVKQEEQLARDLAMLKEMEDGYGHNVPEEGEFVGR